MSIVRVKNREIGHLLRCEQIDMSVTNIKIFHNMPICHSLECLTIIYVTTNIEVLV